MEDNKKCSCKWIERFEGEQSGMVSVLVEKDRRCLEHGKPRHGESK